MAEKICSDSSRCFRHLLMMHSEPTNSVALIATARQLIRGFGAVLA
jgi:hypothetical protein